MNIQQIILDWKAMGVPDPAEGHIIQIINCHGQKWKITNIEFGDKRCTCLVCSTVRNNVMREKAIAKGAIEDE